MEPNVTRVVGVREARSKLDGLLDEISDSHKALLIESETARAVLVSEEDWMALHETLYLLSAEGSKQTLRNGLRAVNRPLLKTARP